MCLKLLQTSVNDYSHFGSHLPSAAECAAHNLTPLVEFVWPLAQKFVIKYLGRVALVCTADGVLWIADTGCGYHLVPEGDVVRGRSVVVPNPGATRLHTANGEIDASECVKFSLTEIGLSKQHATILPETPRVLSVGALCMDMQAAFFWPAGGTPYFTLLDGRVVHCEVHGRVPYIRTGSFASPAGPLATAALPMVAASSNVVPPYARQALPLTAPPPNGSSEEAPSAQRLLQQTQVQQSSLAPLRGAARALPPALAAEDDDDLPALPPVPRPNAALRAEQAEVEDGRDYEAHPLVDDPPPLLGRRLPPPKGRRLDLPALKPGLALEPATLSWK